MSPFEKGEARKSNIVVRLRARRESSRSLSDLLFPGNEGGVLLCDLTPADAPLWAQVVPTTPNII